MIQCIRSNQTMKIRATVISILVISWIKTCSAADDKQNCSDISIDLAANETFVDQETVRINCNINIDPKYCEEKPEVRFKYLSENPNCPEKEKEKGHICYCADIHWIYTMEQPWTAVCVEKVYIHFNIGKNSSEEVIERLVENNSDLRPFKFWLYKYRHYRTFQIEIVEKNGKSTKTPVFNFTVPPPFHGWTHCNENCCDEIDEDKVKIASSTSSAVFPRLFTKIYFVIIALLYEIKV